MLIPDRVLLACARSAHEANRAYCIALGDGSQVSWDDAPAWQRESVIRGVIGVLVNGNGPRESHAAWLQEKAATGWKHGPVKSVTKKEHPCFVPYDDLPESQRKKDDIFVHVVIVIAAALGVNR